MTDTAPVIDQWSYLDHKFGMAGTGGAPAYLDADQARRIKAYARLKAYVSNVARLFLDPEGPDKPEEWREFGDPTVIVAQIAASVLGKEPELVVDGADDPVPPQPVLPDAPTAPDQERGTDIERALLAEAYEASLGIWEEAARAEIESWMERTRRVPLLDARQEWLRTWADDEQLLAKIIENESGNIVPLGSGVYRLDWDPGLGRPTVEIYEPDAYFPVLDTADRGGFPRRVHLAWMFLAPDDSGDGEPVEWVRRITYELVPVDEAEVDIGTRPRYLTADQEWSQACLLSDGRWKLDDFERVDGVNTGVRWETVVIDGEEVELNQAPTGLDFIPLVHVTNTLASATHFGESVLANLVQLFDEIAATDGDESLTSRWAARVPIGISGFGSQSEINLTPGNAAFALADNGRITTIDLAQNLEKIGDRGQRLRKTMSVNGRVPEGLLGRVDASEVPSGLALTLSFTSFEQLIDELRLARVHKYRLLARFAQRIAVQNDAESLGGSVDVYPAGIRFGSFMPQDLAGDASVLGVLRTARLISQETGIKMGQAAGVPVEDPAAELASIRREMSDVADQMTSATEDPRHATEFLGLEFAGPEDGVDAEGGGVVVPPGGTIEPPPA